MIRSILAKFTMNTDFFKIPDKLPCFRRHIGLVGGAKAKISLPFCRQFIYQQNHLGVSTYSYWLRRSSEKIGLGVILSTWTAGGLKFLA
jgi:hypothetical protein